MQFALQYPVMNMLSVNIIYAQSIMNKIVLILLYTFFNLFSNSQNLVMNPSFENYSILPFEGSQYLSGIKSWTLIKGFSQYFHKNGGESSDGFVFRVPFNCIGNQEARSGDAYISFMAVNHGSGTTIIQGKLKEPLKKGRNYYFEIYISLCDIFNLSTSNLWVSFSDSIFPKMVYKTYYHNITKQIENEPTRFYKDRGAWELFSGNFTSNGGEKYFAIGSISKDIKLTGISNSNHRVEFYLDDAGLYDITDDTEYIPGVKFILKDLLFEIGDSALIAPSCYEINKLVKYLKNNPEKKIEIYGHTDNTGENLSNTNLSEARARAVLKRIAQLGIEQSRMKIFGFGSTKPCDTNNTDEGRKNNRRVEIIII